MEVISFEEGTQACAGGPKERLVGYKPAPEAEELAREVIDKYHPHLKEARIVYLYKGGRWQTRGLAVTGRAVVAPQLWRQLCGCDMVLVINEIIFTNLNLEGKLALLDHELSHFTEPAIAKNGSHAWATRDHDVREFSDVVKRHKICMSNLRALAEGGGMEQLDLMKTLSDTVENPDALAEAYNQEEKEESVECEEEENLFCEDYEEL